MKFVCLRAAHSLLMAFAPAHRPVAAKKASRDLTDVLLVASVVFVPVIAIVAAVVVVIKQVQFVVQITEERAQGAENLASQRRISLRKQSD